MRAMTLAEVSSKTGRSQHRGAMVRFYTPLVRNFMESGYEAVEVEPEDVGRSFELGKLPRNESGAIRSGIKNVIVALKLEKMVKVTCADGHLYLVRIDI